MILLFVILGWAVAMPSIVKKVRERRERDRLLSQFRQALIGMVHSLRIGVSFQQALEFAARESDPPLQAAWQRMLQALQLGQTLEEACKEFEKQVPIREVIWFSAAVQITRNTGGSLAEVLALLADSLQQKAALREKVDALTAQGKASGIILGAMPFLLLAVLSVIVPQLVMPMFTTLMGQALLAGVCVSVGVGGLVIWKIVTVRIE